MTEAAESDRRPSLVHVVARRVVELLVGLGLGSVAGAGLLHGLPEAEHKVDLLPPVWEWSPVYLLVVVSWLAAGVVMWFSRRFYFLAMGWLLGVPVWLMVALVYNWHVWGTFGTSPTIP